MNLFSSTIQSLESAVAHSSLKQKVISNNIANADTPDYKAKDVKRAASFPDILSASLAANKTDQRHLDFSGTAAGSSVFTKNNVQYNNNGNSVDIDQEMSSLASNQIYYNAVTELIGSKFQSLQNVIRGGK